MRARTTDRKRIARANLPRTGPAANSEPANKTPKRKGSPPRNRHGSGGSVPREFLRFLLVVAALLLVSLAMLWLLLWVMSNVGSE
jgi:hypothetical protein